MNDKPDNLYHTALPGGVDAAGRTIKAGSATWWKADELPPRKKRPLDVAGVRFGGALRRAVAGAPDSDPDAMVTVGDTSIKTADLELVEGIAPDDIDAMFELNDMVAWAYLKSWTITRQVTTPERTVDGVTYPEATGFESIELPTDPTELLDLPRATYDALLAASAKIHARARDAGDAFSPERAEDAASPIVPSGD